MGVNRRQWLTFAGRFAAVNMGLALWLCRRIVPTRYVQAIRSGTYPGPQRTLADNDVDRPGKWKG
jgi:hypothetical protein